MKNDWMHWSQCTDNPGKISSIQVRDKNHKLPVVKEFPVDIFIKPIWKTVNRKHAEKKGLSPDKSPTYRIFSSPIRFFYRVTAVPAVPAQVMVEIFKAWHPKTISNGALKTLDKDNVKKKKKSLFPSGKVSQFLLHSQYCGIQTFHW